MKTTNIIAYIAKTFVWGLLIGIAYICLIEPSLKILIAFVIIWIILFLAALTVGELLNIGGI